MGSRVYDVLIVGGGVSGAALLHVLARHSNVQRVGLIERRDVPGAYLQSALQALQYGDLETSLTPAEALQAQRAASALNAYLDAQDGLQALRVNQPRLVLGIGDEARDRLQARFQALEAYYPGLCWLEGDALATLEPNVMRGRSSSASVCALGFAEPTPSAMDFSALARHWVEHARACAPTRVDLWMQTRVTEVRRHGAHYLLETSKGLLETRAVVVNAGLQGLPLAQRMGAGVGWCAMPVSGMFWQAQALLRGLVRSIEDPGLPFSGLQAWPDPQTPDRISLGPLALPVAWLDPQDRYPWLDALTLMGRSWQDLSAWVRECRNATHRAVLLKGWMRHVPILRQREMLREARRLIPGLQPEQLSPAARTGGLQAWLLDAAGQRRLGDVWIDAGERVRFNLQSASGATASLWNAWRDARHLAQTFGWTLEEDACLPVSATF